MIKFKELRSRISAKERILIGEKSTANRICYETINEVPASYDGLLLYSIGCREIKEDQEIFTCMEIVFLSENELSNRQVDVGSVVKLQNDAVGIVKEVYEGNCIVDIYYEKDNYLAPPRQINATNKEMTIVDGDDFRVAFLDYMGGRKLCTARDKKRMPAVLKQLYKAWETHPDLRLGQMLMLCCYDETDLFGLEDERLMERLHTVFLDEKKRNNYIL